MKKLTFEEFAERVQGGESRTKPGAAVGYVLVEDEDGTETFYSEWEYEGIETDESGEVTHEGWEQAAEQDAEQAIKAYAEYLSGEKLYKIINNGLADDFSAWGDEADENTIITETELNSLADDWGIPVAELLEQLYEI